MLWILIVAPLVLLVAPLRRHWYIVLPGLAGLVFGLSYAFRVEAEGAPGIILLLAPAMAVAAFVGAFRDAFGRRSGGPKDDEQRH
jgi:hypothetical protein